jgi:hypothetical protein
MRGYVVSEHLNWNQLYIEDGGGRYTLPPHHYPNCPQADVEIFNDDSSIFSAP